NHSHSEPGKGPELPTPRRTAMSRAIRGRVAAWGVLGALAIVLGVTYAEDARKKGGAKEAPASSYAPVVINEPFATTLQRMQADKPRVMRRQTSLLEERSDLSARPAEGVTMGRDKPVQEGVRIKLPRGATWAKLAELTPDEVREQNLWPEGFYPLPHP